MKLCVFCWLVFAGVMLSAEPSVSSVSVIRMDGGGSGTVVHVDSGRSLILTCKHVCPDAAKVYVVANIDGTRKRFPARWLGVSSQYDLAMLSIDATLTAAVIADSNPAVGDVVTHHGKASGPQSGKVSEHKLYADRTIDTQTETLSVPCDSGAGLFNSDGKLCGVVHGMELRRDESENSLSCQVGAIRAFVGQYVPKRIPAKLGE